MADIDTDLLNDILRRLSELEDTVTSLTLDSLGDDSEDEDLDEDFDLDDLDDEDDDDEEDESEDQE